MVIQIQPGEQNEREEENFIPMTIIDDPALDSKVMTDEIFGPVLPIKTFRNF